LLAEAANNRTLKQALNLALSAEDGSAALGASVRKRLVDLAKSTAFVPHERQRELAAELTALRTNIVETLIGLDRCAHSRRERKDQQLRKHRIQSVCLGIRRHRRPLQV
jgi:hypothetical protein